MKGEADAYAIEVKAQAEAEQMAKKAAAWGQYEHAAVIDMLLKTLPQVNLQLLHYALSSIPCLQKIDV